MFLIKSSKAVEQQMRDHEHDDHNYPRYSRYPLPASVEEDVWSAGGDKSSRFGLRLTLTQWSRSRLNRRPSDSRSSAGWAEPGHVPFDQQQDRINRASVEGKYREWESSEVT